MWGGGVRDVGWWTLGGAARSHTRVGVGTGVEGAVKGRGFGPRGHGLVLEKAVVQWAGGCRSSCEAGWRDWGLGDAEFGGGVGWWVSGCGVGTWVEL
ncbi:hypothetical protein Aglo03_60840 [Actinokineospora globicatena]|uniref:Uncharacterized protein n=1 Tax=Actinokineospora globicatena TaxID=103729 RepID=A0A9W6VDR3_9PSEU|nr:hypothetical protein Aglo03_60840 [Actinokineospora globicatena]